MGGESEQMKAGDGIACRACQKSVRLEGVFDPCRYCGYVNYRMQETFPYGWLTPALSGASVEKLFHNRLERAIELIEGDMPKASTLLAALVAEREDMLRPHPERPRSLKNESFPAVLNLGMQILYLLLCERGGVHLPPFPLVTRASTKPGELEMCLVEAGFLASRCLREAGHEAEYQVNGKTLLERFTNTGNLVAETADNDLRVQRKFPLEYEVLDESELYAMQKAVLGFSNQDFMELGRGNFANLRKLTTVQASGPILVAKLDGANEPAATLLGALLLTRRRVQTFRFPYYFDLGTPRTGSPPGALPAETYAINWTAYYPCYEVDIDGIGRSALLTKMTFVNSMTYTLASRSLMAAELEKRAGSIDTPEAKSIKNYQQRVSARLEQRIEGTLRGSGFSTKANLKEFPGLPKGEIDVLGARTRKKITEIVLIEAKDFDMPIQKPGSFEKAVADLTKAVQKQLLPLTEFVKKEWRSLLQELGVKPAKRVVLCPLLVTRRYMAPNVVPDCTVVGLNALECVLSRFSHRNLEAKDGIGPIPRIVLQLED
jgi:hypothetical protein